MQSKKKPILLLNILFTITCITIFLFLLKAPEETTTKLPKDDIHISFHSIKSKKEAEKNCESCHNPEGEAPLPLAHPPKYRCLFCHKR